MGDETEGTATSTAGLFSGFGDGLAGVVNNLAKSYGTALGARVDSFGGLKPGGVTDPAVQTLRNPLTGEVYRGGTSVSGGLAVPMWMVLAGAVAVIGGILLLRR